MGCSGGLATADNHLIERTALAKLRIEFATKFTRPAGPSIETADDGMVDVFHENGSWGRRNLFARVMRQSHSTLARMIHHCLDGSLYYNGRELYKPLLAGADLAANFEPLAVSGELRPKAEARRLKHSAFGGSRRRGPISGMIRRPHQFWRPRGFRQERVEHRISFRCRQHAARQRPRCR